MKHRLPTSEPSVPIGTCRAKASPSVRLSFKASHSTDLGTPLEQYRAHHPGRRTRLDTPIFRRHQPGASERGIALVITLILLAVITFMAITFLVLSRNEKGSVTTTADQAKARGAADAAQAQALSKLMAMIMTSTNPYNFDLLVSTNYVNSLGFQQNGSTDPLDPFKPNAYNSPTNVSYTYPDGTPLRSPDNLQNLANLLYDPRPPVYIPNPTNPISGIPDFRYYLDLNRNGKFEPSGLLPVMTPYGPYIDTNGFPKPQPIGVLSNYFVGDPQWIGILEHPVFPPGIRKRQGFPVGFAHGPNDRFISRYAYLVVPASKTLDINFIHNYSKRLAANMGSGDGFLRNQGVGAWEINLASFLADLNTNVWYFPAGYRYNWQDQRLPNIGAAFDDALSLLRYRYGGNYGSLLSVADVFKDPNGKSSPGIPAFRFDYIDGYTHGPVMTNLWWQPIPRTEDGDFSLVQATPWSGADNTNHFFTSQDLFDPLKTSAAFSNRLWYAGAQTNSSYDRYTLYRLLSQLGTDSEPEEDQINLNYRNVDEFGNVVPNMATNLIPWTNATLFFTSVANKLLTNYYGTNNIYGLNSAKAGSLNINHIPVYPTNFYTPGVHRLLQLAANIYDASTNRFLDSLGTGIGMPSVFRPIFASQPIAPGTNEIYIAGYEEVTNVNFMLPPPFGKSAPPMHDLSNPLDRVVQPRDMIYGVPLIVGAKKGLPNFNEFAMQTLVQVTRKLEFRRARPDDARPSFTNQMFVVTVSNVFGVEAWNSYSNSYPHDLGIMVAVDTKVQLTNEVGKALIRPSVGYFFTNFAAITNISAAKWSGFQDFNHASFSFQIPLSGAFMALSNSTYSQNAGQFIPLTGLFENTQPRFRVPHWWMNLSPRLRFIIYDKATHRIIDYVNLSASESTLDVTDMLMRDNPQTPNDGGPSYVPTGSDGGMWYTNRWPRGGNENSPTYGILNQIGVGAGNISPQNWSSFVQMSPPGQDRQAAIDFFRYQFGLGPIYNPGATFSRSNTFYAPFVPVRNIYVYTKWQANDPLVHYTVGDLMDLQRSATNINFLPPNPLLPNIGRVNERYEPWGGNPTAGSTSPTRYEMAVKDPLVTRSDDWLFPTNKLPNVGWLGRVHRGTPWQTVYLKSPEVALPLWMKWTGNGVLVTNVVGPTSLLAGPPNSRSNFVVADAMFTLPVMDRYMLDLFTTSFNENAARGQLSINQTNLAAWSAVLGGVAVLTNIVSEKDFAKNAYAGPTNAPFIIEPAGIYNPFVRNATGQPPIVRIVAGINETRRTNLISAATNYYSLYPYKRFLPAFGRVGEILETPELTVASPFLNTSATNVTLRGINDAMYERIPQQILGLLKSDPVPRFVIYSYGQTLKPADRSILTSGPFFGMCTNYQITAEVVTRSVVRVEGLPIHPQPYTDLHQFKNLKLILENYNVLPPD